MGGPQRIETVYRRQPLTPKTGGAAGEKGEMKIDSATDYPDAVGDADFDLADENYEAPRMLTVKCRIAGSAADDSSTLFSLMFWDANVQKWHEPARFQAVGKNKVDEDLGNVWHPECPEGSSKCMIHVPSIAANVELHFTVYPSN